MNGEKELRRPAPFIADDERNAHAAFANAGCLADGIDRKLGVELDSREPFDLTLEFAPGRVEGCLCGIGQIVEDVRLGMLLFREDRVFHPGRWRELRSGVDLGGLDRLRLDRMLAGAIGRLGFCLGLGGELLTSQAANDVFGERRKGLENARIFGCNGLEYGGPFHIEFPMQFLERVGVR